ncbi:unnamed protein product [Clonostachys rhizophaga]|uniref:Uncharacterized protein n=1 Tax=Clonostachys rhizophaga TaxID=160324 RepID=A0A9N9V974_9HYPO|nr:unnamed protein product [Clonostachys rhizophaga]
MSEARQYATDAARETTEFGSKRFHDKIDQPNHETHQNESHHDAGPSGSSSQFVLPPREAKVTDVEVKSNDHKKSRGLFKLKQQVSGLHSKPEPTPPILMSKEINPSNANGNSRGRNEPYVDTPPESDTEGSDISSISEDSVNPEIHESKAETSVVSVEFTIEELDPLDDSWDTLEVIHPYNIEYPRRRTSSFHKDLDKALVADLQNLACSDSGPDLDEEEDAFLRKQRILRRRRLTSNQSFGKRTHEEHVNWDDDDELSGGDEHRGNRKMQKRVHRSSLLFKNPPAPFIEPFESDSDVEDDLESLFSSFSASSMESLTTLDQRQRSGVTLLTELLFNHRELSPLYRLAISRVEIGKLRTHLYGFFRIYGKELHREASDEKEKLAAQFIRRCARLLANAICQSLQSESGEEDWSSLLSVERVSMEQNVNEWINASLTNVEGLMPQAPECEDKRVVESSRAEMASSESSNEDYEVVYQEAEDYLLLSEVEHFILSADAFSNLRLALRSWLNLDDGDPADPNPKANEDMAPLEADPSTPSSKQTSQMFLALQSKIWRAGMTIFRNIQNVFVLTGFREPELVGGYQRVRWKNNKGKSIFEDYVENEPGALRALEAYLNTSAYQKNNTGSISASSSSNEQRTHNTKSSASGSNSSNTLPTNVSCHSGQGIGPDETTAAFERDIELTASPSESLHLFTCIERGFHKLDFHQKIITNIPNDQTLFGSLREEYYCGYRGSWRRIVSLRAIQSVHFMKFLYGGPGYIDPRCHEEVCEKGKPCDCIPPSRLVCPTGTEYKCSPVPARLSPPVGSRLMMDFFTDPAGISKNSTFVLQQLPKRTYGELRKEQGELVEAWGIYFKEGWNWSRIWWVLGLAVFPPSLLFGLLWSVLRQDIQGAFGVASWWLTSATILIGILGTQV